MKKVIISVMCIFTLALCGCDMQKQPVIGGADGPTDVYVSKNKNTYKKEPIRMVKIDGALYYETGEDRENVGRCGNMDGNFSQTVGMYELPQNDNESNFGDANSYQRGSIADTVEILIGDDWEIFKKLNAEGVDGFKYCCKLETEDEDFGRDVDYLVLSNKENVTLEEAMDFLTADKKNGDMYVVSIYD